MRTQSAFYNSLATVGQRLLKYILVFVTRTVFIKTLGVTYLGVNSLFADIFNMLSLMELGVGTALTFFMYEPIANDDIPRIKSLMQMYGKLYRTIGLLMLVIGIGLIPFLDYLVNTDVAINNLTLIYILMLLNTVVSYFFSYKRAIFIAHQKEYINSINELIFDVIKNAVQIIILLTTQNFILYLCVAILCTFASNFQISILANRTFTYLNDKDIEPISQDEHTHIFSRIRAVFVHKLATVSMYGIDNVLFSIFVSIQFVGLYSNYVTIRSVIDGIINSVFNSLTASIGNLSVTDSDENSHIVFKRLTYFNLLVVSMTSLGLYFLFNPFIELWLGKGFLLEPPFVLLIIINYYLSNSRHSALAFVNARGLFYDTRFKPIVEAILKLICSIILGRFFGTFGVLWGSIISFVFTIWVDPYMLYNKWFNQSIKEYIMYYIKWIILTVFVGFITQICLRTFLVLTSNFLITLLFVVFSVTTLTVVLTYRTAEQKYFRDLLIKLVKQNN